MTTDQEMARIVRSWLEPGLTTLTDDVLDPVLDQLPATPQWRPMWPRRRIQHVSAFAKFSLAAAALVVVAIVGLNLASRSGQPVVGAPASPSPSVASPSPSSAVSPATSPEAAASLPVLGLPRARGGPPGVYGWEGRAGGALDGMHRVVQNGEATAMFFAVGPGCLGAGGAQPAVPVRVAGFDGVSIEPYEPPLRFNDVGDELTRAYQLAVDDRTLCVFVTWHPKTTGEELRAATQILETIRAQPVGLDGIRINFVLQDSWDTG